MNFTIHSLGDAAFLYAVLNAVSSIPESVYMQLGGLGAVIGLLIMGVKGVNEGNLMKAGFQGLIVSLVIFWIMFIPRVDEVVIRDMAPSPTSPPMYVVDNVPAGFAAVGATMSTVGVYIARLFDQAFGDVDENRVLTGGIGDNLQRITMLRHMADPVFVEASNVTSLNQFRHNLAQYIAHCSMTGLSTGELSNRTLSVTTDVNGDSVVNALDGMHFPHQALQTRLRNPAAEGGSEVVSCATAGSRILAIEGFNPEASGPRGDPEMAAAFDEAMAGRATFGSTIGTMQRFGMPQAAQWVQSAMVNQVVAAATLQSMRVGGDSQSGMLGAMMVEEAAARRNVQFAGEQNMFLRTMRTTIGFFEAVFYALGPIMAILVMVGPLGVTIASKYIMLTVWVLLWYPMLAIINLYGNVKMQTLVTELAANPDYVTSPIGTHQIMVIAQDQLGTVAGLVAATPILAMSLIYGGAVAMNAVASRLTGGDQINEGMVAPQAMDVAPAMQNMSQAGSSKAGGLIATGASMPSAQLGTMAQESVKTAQAMQEQRTSAFMAEVARSSEASNGFTISASTKEVASDGSTFNDNLSNGLQFASQENMQIANSLSTLEKLGASVNMEMGLSSGKYIPIFSVGTSNAAQSAEERAQVDQAVASLNSAFSQDASASKGFAEGLARSVQAETSQTGSNSRTDSISSNLKESAGEVVSATRSYESAQTLASSGGFDDTRTFSQIAAGWETAGTKNANFAALDSRKSDIEGGAQVFEEAYASAIKQDYTTDQAALMGYAAVASMQGRTPEQIAAIQDMRSEFLSRASLINSPVPGGIDQTAAASLAEKSVSLRGGGDFDPASHTGSHIPNAPQYGAVAGQAAGVRANAQGTLDRVAGEVAEGRAPLVTPEARLGEARSNFETAKQGIDSKFDLSSPMGAMMQRISGEGSINHLQIPGNVSPEQSAATLGAAKISHLQSEIEAASSPSFRERLGIGDTANAAVDREMKVEQLRGELAQARSDFSSLPAEDRAFASRVMGAHEKSAGGAFRTVDVSDVDSANQLLHIAGNIATQDESKAAAAQRDEARREFLARSGH